MAKYQEQRRFHHARMTGAQFTEALDDLDMTVADLARITGTREDRIVKWKDGKETVPAYMPVLIALLLLPGGMERAMQVAEIWLEAGEEGLMEPLPY